eukprot:scaffold11427_cov100-Skeletonema_dohrnii-CCMP3373.AAC.4
MSHLIKKQSHVSGQASDDNNMSVKICDFSCGHVHVPQSLTTQCGTNQYLATELLMKHPYNESADMMSVCVIIYGLLAGRFPFEGSDDKDLHLGDFWLIPNTGPESLTKSWT